jgi:alpha-L-rhamnosidase
MIAWVEWCRANSTGLIRERARGNDYGDWLSIGADTPKDLIGTAYFAHSADLLARSLRVLGRGTEAERYERLFGEIREAFIERYVDADGRVHGDTQTAYVMALRFGLLPESLRSVAAARLVADIEARQDRISTGFVGVSHLLHVLTDAGHSDVAYRLLMQDEFPSWLFSVKHGATTIWERWNGWTPETGPHPDISMNSFNHYALGSCGRWLFESAAGIAPDPDAPGFARVIIRPRPDAALGAASATYDSIRGTIESHWTLDEDGLRMRVTVPPNVRATVWIPSDPEGRVLESGALLGEAPGVRVVGREAGCVVVEVGSGTYQFSAAVGTTRRGI